jgi:hypothetical protein
MSDPLTGRTTDPATSTPGIRKQVNRLKDWTLEAALVLGTFTDSELTYQVEHMSGARQQRGTIARTRLNIERHGAIERTTELTNGQITFVVVPAVAMRLMAVAA